jgi:hypothetical protein
MAIIVPVPKKVTELNDYRLIVVTSVIVKCFERLVKDHITSILPVTLDPLQCFERLVKDHITSTLPVTLDPLQFAFRPNRSTDDAITIALYAALTHLDKKNTYVRMLFIDYSSAFNTIVPTKLRALGLNPALCNWVLGFLTGHPQVL